MDLFYTQIKTKLGILHVNATNSFLTSLSWKEKKFKPIIKKINPILKEVKNQINFYMKGKKINFDVPLNPKGTIFQKKVWNNIKKIKCGKNTTYKEITNKVFKKKIPLALVQWETLVHVIQL